MFGWIFVTLFSARLSSSLSVHKVEKINGISDLYDKGYELYVLKGSAFVEKLKDAAQGSKRKEIWDKQASEKR